MAAKMYKFRLARALEETREMSMSLESTWDAIHQNISAGFSSKMTGGIRFLQVVKSANSEAIGERITDAGKFWLAIVKWYDANSTVFLVYDDSLVELELQLLGPLSPVVKAQTPFMGTYSDLVSVVYRCYPYLSTGAARHEVRHFSAVRGGAVVDMKFTSAEQLWDWYTAIVSTRDPPRFVIAIDGFARIDVATSVCEKFSIYVPKDCAMDMLNTIILETVVQLRCSRYDVESISVRSARGSEDLTSTDQLPALFNVSTSWLYASLRSVSEPVVASRKPAATPASPSTDAAAYSVRFCLRGDRSVFCTVKLSQGCTIDEIKSAVAAKCTSISGTDIKHFILLDKDGDEFSSGLDTVTKFWRIAVKYFKDNFSRDFIFNVVLNPLPASSKKPTIKPEMNVPSPEPNVQAFVPPRALSPVSPVVSISTATTNDLTTSSGMKSSPAVNSSSLREKNSIILDSSHSDIKVVKTEPMEIVLAKTATAPPILVPAPIPAAPSSIESIMIAVDVKKSSHDKAEATKSNDVYKAAAPQTAIPGTIVHFKLTAAAQKSIMPSRRLELMRKKERDGGSSSIEADLFTIQLSYGCSWNAVLDAVCKATGIPAPSDISHFVPTVGGKPVQEKASDSTLIVDRFQFWAIMKRAGSTGEIILWEVHVGVKFSAPGLQSPKIGKGVI